MNTTNLTFSDLIFHRVSENNKSFAVKNFCGLQNLTVIHWKIFAVRCQTCIAKSSLEKAL